MGDKRLRLTYYQRKPRKVGNYSVEFIFDDVRRRLADKIDVHVAYSSFESTGVFKRIYNCIEAVFRQGNVNHVTGDINYIGLFLSGRRTVQTILDCVHLTHSSGVRYKILRLFWLSIPASRSKYLTAISESTKQEILRHVSCDPQKIRVIYVAISEKFSYKPKPFNKQCPRILQIGTAPNKNIPRLIEALKGIPCVLEIVGKQNDEYEQLLKSNNVQYEYKWGLTDEQMLHRYEEADIITLASTYEGFGMPILEGQAVGRPVITASVFSMPEVAGDAAVMVDPYNVGSIREGLLKIINDDAFRDELVRKGRENIKRFDAEKIALQYYELYKDVASRQ